MILFWSVKGLMIDYISNVNNLLSKFQAFLNLPHEIVLLFK
jgi:hypothetical protein